jgi:hypothetical protein
VNPFALGHYRPLNLLSGVGTVRMARLKFLGQSIDEKSYQLVHSAEGAERVANMGFNWVLLAFNWGFPPEIEERDWEDFRSAQQHYHRVGIKVLGYIQSSNCVYEGSYVDKDWYALDPDGWKIHYYRGRYFTSLVHPEWRAEVQGRVERLLDYGADGIYFDNVWGGGVGIDLADMPLGIIGSYDEYSQQAYAEAYPGAEIPLVLDLKDAETQQYLKWRTQVVVTAVREWAQVAREVKADVVITANAYDAVMRNSFAALGIDLEGLARELDVVTIEDFSFPRTRQEGSVVANAVTVSAAQGRSEDKTVATVPYIRGVGYEHMWLVRQFNRALTEAIAANAPLVVNGVSYLHRNSFTTLLHSRYEPQRLALRKMNQWLIQHRDWLSTRKNSSALAVYHPYAAMHWNWNRIAPLFFAVCETLLLNGLPLRVVGDEEWDSVQRLIVPAGEVEGLEKRLIEFSDRGGKVIPVGQSRAASSKVLWEGWQPRQFRQRIPNRRWLRRRINQGAAISWRIYHKYRIGRWLAARMKIHRAMTDPPMFFVPPVAMQAALLEAVGHDFVPRVEAEGPVLLTVWSEEDGTQQWHIVNYMDTPQRVTLHLNQLTDTWVYTPGEEEEPTRVVGTSIMLSLDVAKVIRMSMAEE